jgi:hypothetical protein
MSQQKDGGGATTAGGAAPHEHEIVLIGMVNVNRDNYLQGTVDVWRCRGCRKLFCDDKRYGEPLKASVGFEEVAEGEKWGILTCTDIKEVFMMSLGVKPGKKLAHTCKSNGTQHEFIVRDDWTIAPEEEGTGVEGVTIHRLFLVEDYINKAIEAGFYKLGMLK